MLLAVPSAAQLQDWHSNWNEPGISWDSFKGSSLLSQIESIIGSGPENRRDALHFDSAYKTGCQVFLTGDKGEFGAKKDALEHLTGIKVFQTSIEIDILFNFLKEIK